MNPSLTIIIPVYNASLYLEQCLDSLLVDNGFTGQVVCVNDGSTDDSLEILRHYEKLYENLEIFSQPNRGQAVARNVGLKHAMGDYVIYLDSDDYYLPNAISTICSIIIQNPDVDVFYTDCAITEEQKRMYTIKSLTPIKMPLQSYYEYEYSQYRTIPQGCICGMFYKREFLLQNHIQMAPGLRYEDALFVIEVFLQKGTCLAVHLDHPYYHYRNNREGATTTEFSISHYADRREIAHKAYQKIIEMDLLTPARKKRLFELYEENFLQAGQNKLNMSLTKFFDKEDMVIMNKCAEDERQKKICKLAKFSPNILSLYMAEKLPVLARKCVNHLF